jgi:hypothetical protein
VPGTPASVVLTTHHPFLAFFPGKRRWQPAIGIRAQSKTWGHLSISQGPLRWAQPGRSARPALISRGRGGCERENPRVRRAGGAGRDGKRGDRGTPPAHPTPLGDRAWRGDPGCKLGNLVQNTQALPQPSGRTCPRVPRRAPSRPQSPTSTQPTLQNPPEPSDRGG